MHDWEALRGQWHAKSYRIQPHTPPQKKTSPNDREVIKHREFKQLLEQACAPCDSHSPLALFHGRQHCSGNGHQSPPSYCSQRLIAWLGAMLTSLSKPCTEHTNTNPTPPPPQSSTLVLGARATSEQAANANHGSTGSTPREGLRSRTILSKKQPLVFSPTSKPRMA